MRSTIIIQSLTLVILSVLFTKCTKQDHNEGLPETGKSKVTFEIDERTEFFRTVFNLATEGVMDEELRPCHTAYYSRVKNHFLDVKDHPLITYVLEDDDIGIDFSVIGLMYKDLDTFEFDQAYVKELESLGMSVKKLDSLKPMLKDFYQEANFKKFFESNADYYKKAIAALEQQVNGAALLDSLKTFFQSDENDLELTVFVELTNNAVNKAVTFYDHYNENSRAVILANICELPELSTKSNEVLQLDADIKGILYHEAAHLFTDKLLVKHVKDLEPFGHHCEGCSEVRVKDKIDHMIVYPIQGLLSYSLDKNSDGHNFYINKCTDVRRDIYKKLSTYDPEGDEKFETIYVESLKLIKKLQR